MHPSFLVFVFLMARGGPGAKWPRSSTQQVAEAQPAEDAGSEYNPADDSDQGSQDEDWEAIHAETRSKKAADEATKEKEKTTEKGKGKAKGKEKEKGKGKEKRKEKDKGKATVAEKGKGKMVEPEVTYTKGPRRTIGIEIREPGTSPPRVSLPIDQARERMYSSKRCVGERHVGVANLYEKVPGFEQLFENGDLHDICNFPERTGYGLELIREFYMRAGHLVEEDGGPYSFTTMVREVEITVTPELIASVIDMEARVDGVDYMHAGFGGNQDWRMMLDALCVPDPENLGTTVLSKDLKIEYRFINFIVCYNIMPLANTKVIRWDRLLYMYLLGRPDIVKDRNINLNVPFLVWKRMAREIKTASQKDRLPFPMIIMRILRKKDVDVACTSVEHPLGPISDTTMAKSHIQLHPNVPPPAPAAPPPAPAPAPPPAQATSSTVAPEGDITLTTVYQEQRRLSGELEQVVQVQTKLEKNVAQMSRRYGRMSSLLRLLCTKMGCTSSEMPEPDTDTEEDTE